MCAFPLQVLGRISSTEDLIRDRVVAPFVNLHVNKDSLRAVALGGPDSGLADMLSKVVAFTQGPLAPLVPRPRGQGQGPPAPGASACASFDFVGGAVLRHTAAVLAQHGALVCAPAIPDDFHRNYTALARFLHSLELLLPAGERRAALRSHPSRLELLRKSSVPLYLQLRAQALTAGLEEALAAGVRLATAAQQGQVAGQVAGAGGGLALAASCVALHAARRCWGSDVCLAEEGPKFLELSLQIVARCACTCGRCSV
jgi:hypothetical protein